MENEKENQIKNGQENLQKLDKKSQKNAKKEEKLKTKQQKMSRKEKKAYRKANNIPTLWHYLKNYKLHIFFYIFFTLVMIVSSIFNTIIAANAIADVTEAISASGAAAAELFRRAIIEFVIVLLLFILERVLTFVLNTIYLKFSTKIISQMNNDLAYQAFKFSASTYSNNNTGTFVQRIVNDPNRMINQLVSVVDLFAGAVQALIISIYIITINYIIGLILVAGMIANFIVEKIRLKLRGRNIKIANKKYDKINSLTTEIVKSERDVKSLGLEEKLKLTTERYYNDYNNFNYKRSMQNQSLNQLRNLIYILVSMGALILGVVLLEKGLLVFASYMIIYSNRSSFNTFIMQTSAMLDIKNEVTIYGQRIFDLFDNNKFSEEKFGDVDLENVKGKIEFKNVSYGYIDKLKDKDDLNKEDENSEIVKNKSVFQNLSFIIEPDTTVAFVGKSGSGKSTILSLMSKMYEVDSGQVLIDDVNINDLSKETLRKNISLVNQFPYIFDMSIKENLLLAKANATDEEIEDAIERSYLEEFIETLPNGIETIVGESGIKLSGGQRQRLAIARAMLRKSSIILFDESTSSLDNLAQEHIKQSIDDMKGSSTIVIVAHRLSTIKNVDKIYFLDEGEIIDSGTFEELFDKNEKFRRMFLAEDI